LYFRLNVLPIKMPALRERTHDIPFLIAHFIERFCALESKPLKAIAPEAIDMLCDRYWHGNVRELENAVHRALVLCENNALGIEDFTAILLSPLTSEAGDKTHVYNLPLIESDGRLRTLEEIERDILKFGLKRYNKNITQAAAALGIAKSTFYRRMKEIGLPKDA
jgi:DNA-binding NtrC family response regulator